MAVPGKLAEAGGAEVPVAGALGTTEHTVRGIEEAQHTAMLTQLMPAHMPHNRLI
jgi:hypothetical protein